MDPRNQTGNSTADRSLCGVLNLNKPRGLTSRDVVDRVQRLIRPLKCGHAGTLDPLAEGVLVVCVGSATRLIQFVQQQPKTYVAEFLLGQTSDTDDVDGAVQLVTGAALPVERQILAALPAFCGEVLQRPPAYSALKIQGQRAYKLARRGEPVNLAPRPVRIDSIELLSFDPPRMTLEIQCGSGVYVRSIGRDLGEQFGCGAVMSQLTRTAIGGFRRGAATAPGEMANREAVAQRLHPPLTAVSHLPRQTCSDELVRLLASGQEAPCPAGVGGLGGVPGDWCAVVDSLGRLRTVARWKAPGRLRAQINLPAP